MEYHIVVGDNKDTPDHRETAEETLAHHIYEDESEHIFFSSSRGEKD